jgi:hypothetical protein
MKNKAIEIAGLPASHPQYFVSWGNHIKMCIDTVSPSNSGLWYNSCFKKTNHNQLKLYL